MGNVISIANVKGGVGKTTIVHNLSNALAIQKKKVLMVDLDIQENLSDRSLPERVDGMHSSYDLIGNEDVLPKECIYKTNIEGVDIIPSRVDIADVRRCLVSYNQKEQLTMLKKRLELISSSYDFILLDLHPSLDFLLASAMIASDAFLIPVLPSIDSIKGVNLTVRFANELQKMNPKLQELGVVISNYDTRTKVSEQITNKLSDVLKERLFYTKIARCAGIQKAAAEFKTTFEYNKKLRCNQDYLRLAEEIISKCS